MAIRAISHVAVGVRDMDRALRFYRDGLGLRVKLDTTEEIPAFEGSAPRKRRAAYLGWSEGPHESFVVLDQPLDVAATGEPARLFQTGIHHFSFWVDDIAGSSRACAPRGWRCCSSRAWATRSPTASRPAARCSPPSCAIPDGNYVQLDQRA
jgi:catechol 2,3-dioxygenase-like lactoylglutathione lyase family enzyme